MISFDDVIKIPVYPKPTFPFKKVRERNVTKLTITKVLGEKTYHHCYDHTSDLTLREFITALEVLEKSLNGEPLYVGWGDSNSYVSLAFRIKKPAESQKSYEERKLKYEESIREFEIWEALPKGEREAIVKRKRAVEKAANARAKAIEDIDRLFLRKSEIERQLLEAKKALSSEP
jgi:hypothetical protein